MSKFDEFLEAFSYNPETFNADQFKAALKSVYSEDIESVNSVATAKDATITQLNEKITKLGSDNWALLMKQGTPIPPNNDSGSHVNPEGEEAELPSLSDAFKKG